MMHDFGVSKNHTVILDLPLSLTPFNLLKNQPVVFYEPEKPARFGVFPRHKPGDAKWFETAGCCIFHTANTWDEYNSSGETIAVNMLACRLTSASLVFSAGNITIPPYRKKQVSIKPRRPMSFFVKYDEDEIVDVEKLWPSENTPLLKPQKATAEASPKTTSHISEDDEDQCRLYHYRFSLMNDCPTITHQYALSSIPFEFPTFNPAYEMSFARYIYGCSTSNETFGAALGKATKIDVLVKMDIQTLLARSYAFPPKSITGCVDSRKISEILATDNTEDHIHTFKMPPNYYAQEARFVSRYNPVSEDDGYLLFYAFDESQVEDSGVCRADAVSELWIIDAKNMRDIIAKIWLPQRVPYGLHGNWFTEEQIASQRGIDRVRAMPDGSQDSVGKKVKRALISALR
jgi:carotenoid cleavage dioxygenase-like enzyme